MAILGTNSTSNYYSIADASALTFANSDWCIGFICQLVSNTGTGDQNFVGSGDVSVANAFNFYLRGTSSATNPDKWRFNICDSTGSTNEIFITASIATPVDYRYRWMIATRKG